MNKNMLAFAISIVAQAFEHKLDKGGKPYAMHCLRVMQAMASDDEQLQQIAVLHDLVEDTPWTIEELRHEGFSERVLTAVELLTLADGEYYDAYIKRIALNEDARRVKLADLEDNSQVTRLKGLTKVDMDRLEKYCRSYTYLSKV